MKNQRRRLNVAVLILCHAICLLRFGLVRQKRKNVAKTTCSDSPEASILYLCFSESGLPRLSLLFPPKHCLISANKLMRLIQIPVLIPSTSFVFHDHRICLAHLQAACSTTFPSSHCAYDPPALQISLPTPPTRSAQVHCTHSFPRFLVKLPKR